MHVCNGQRTNYTTTMFVSASEVDKKNNLNFEVVGHGLISGFSKDHNSSSKVAPDIISRPFDVE